MMKTIFSLDELPLLLEDFKVIKTNKKINYLNVESAFDIEVSSFYQFDEKRCCMYAWVFGINGKCIIGRTWDEAMKLFNDISDYYKLDLNNRLIVYVHNLSYEFQFFKHFFNWENVFAIEERKPIYALSKMGIEFRCSYLLTGYNLETVGKNLKIYHVEKKVGDLDYSLIRHSKTPLTTKEKGYILNDALVVMAHIKEEMERLGNITRIPLTKTGYVRNYCRKCCTHKRKWWENRSLMNELQITSPQEYLQLKRAFQGGFTHANHWYVTKIMENVTSYDFTSSYPSVMMSERFPMSSGKLVEIKTREDFDFYIKRYCCLFDVKFKDMKPKLDFEHPISTSKCRELKNYIADNGRLVRCESMITTITDVDFEIIEKFYKWEKMSVKNFRIYKRGYLPKNFIESIIKLYEDKTTLKGVEGMEVEYQHSKEQLNSTYGMTVTDICRDLIEYMTEWTTTSPDLTESLEKYNRSKKRFLFYPWGVWITAYARRNLFTGIVAFGYDYIYSDTDSIKVINVDKHKDYFVLYNQSLEKKLHKMCDLYDIDYSRISPKTIKGETKLIGVWDYDGFYTRFKTLGAKRYMVEKEDHEISLTVSGVSKYHAIPYLLEHYATEKDIAKLKEKHGGKFEFSEETRTNVFNAFDEGLLIPSTYESLLTHKTESGTGKNLHTYIDESHTGYVTDYKGKEAVYRERSGVHMESTSYELSFAHDFIQYLKGVRTKLL